MDVIIYDFDFVILDALQEIHSEALNYIMMAITYMGELGILWIVLSAVLLCIPKKRAMGLTTSAALGMMIILTEGIAKHIIRRSRPFTLHPWVDTFISEPITYSFPSGHTSAAFAMATAIFIFDKKLGTVVYIISAGIGFSRMYFYVHYPTDVICGAICGIIIGILAAKLVKKFVIPRFGEKLRIPEQ